MRKHHITEAILMALPCILGAGWCHFARSEWNERLAKSRDSLEGKRGRRGEVTEGCPKVGAARFLTRSMSRSDEATTATVECCRVARSGSGDVPRDSVRQWRTPLPSQEYPGTAYYQVKTWKNSISTCEALSLVLLVKHFHFHSSLSGECF